MFSRVYIRTSLVLAVLLLVFALQQGSPRTIALTARDMMANAVGVSAGVAPNRFNVLAQQLAEKEAELEAREAAVGGVIERERATYTEQTKLAVYSFGASAILFLLVVANFFFDFRRGRSSGVATRRRFSIDLKR